MSDMNDAAPADDDAHEADSATEARSGAGKGRSRTARSSGGMDTRYLKELQAFLEAEAGRCASCTSMGISTSRNLWRGWRRWPSHARRKAR